MPRPGSSDRRQAQDYSRQVNSSQRFTHPRLGERVRKHLRHGHLRPPAGHTLEAFASLERTVATHTGPLVFDSFCGTGASTRLLASLHPGCLVIGLDKSAQRLARHDAGEQSNYHLVRADCGDFWRLAAAAGWELQGHYLFYPNPWPKSRQLGRRVHGSADFAALLQLGGNLELRSNWQLYTEEFGSALVIAGYRPYIDQVQVESPVSLFERKYADSHHSLWRCRCRLGDNKLTAGDTPTAGRQEWTR